MSNSQFSCCVKRRLGLPIKFEGWDRHGHYNLAIALGGRTQARHTTMIAAWRQVFNEAGGHVPDRNIERLLKNTHDPVPANDQRRLDLVVPGLNVANGLPLFCDVTVISPLSRNGRPRGGTSNKGGTLLQQADRKNNANYHEVISSGLGTLYSLGFEVYGRWHTSCIDLLDKLAREHSRGLSSRIRQGVYLSYLHRWSDLLAIAL